MQIAELPEASAGQHTSPHPAHGQVEQNGRTLYCSHLPSTHSSSSAHRFPQPPQFRSLVWVSTQPPAQVVSEPPHPPVVHLPAAQSSPPRHFVPQAPQFCGSPAVSTHVPTQLANPGLHAQTPAAQA